MIMNEPVSGRSWSWGLVGRTQYYQSGEERFGPLYQDCEQVAVNMRLLLVRLKPACDLHPSQVRLTESATVLWGLEGLS